MLISICPLNSLPSRQPIDILILSNGPGEITTWVRPVVKALRQKLGEDPCQVRISVVLSPCPNATGKEAAIARSYPEVDRVQSSTDFFPFLLWGKTAEAWDWRQRGVVIFLGGDQFFPVVIGKRLGYRTVIYAEWDARWYRWVDSFGVMNASVIEKVPGKYRYKFAVVGDLMVDIASQGTKLADFSSPVIGILPGSKAGKLKPGVPFCLAIAQKISQIRPETRFILPLAPTLDLDSLASFANPQDNPLVEQMGGVSAKIVQSEGECPYLLTSGGVRVEVVTQFPAHEFLCQCHLALTTVGANTAELGALGVPMIVLIPTQKLDAMRSWDGIAGILANSPLIGSVWAKLINWLIIKQGRLFAWPNIWAKEEIVPELVGELQPTQVAEIVLEFLENPLKLEQIRDRLRQVRGETGAATKIAELVSSQVL